MLDGHFHLGGNRVAIGAEPELTLSLLPSAHAMVFILGADTGRRLIGLRADLDALPIPEETGLPWASERSGVSHACGHDVHVTCLLGAAEELAEECEAWAGTLVVLFQPAEEGLGGARAMLAAPIAQTEQQPVAWRTRSPMRNLPRGADCAMGDS